MSALRAVLLLLLCGMAPNVSAAKLHHLDVGFNLGYPDRVHFFEPALAEIQRLGIRDVRIYEVFDGHKGNSYQARLKGALDRVLAHGMVPLLTISNVHTRLLPDDASQRRLVGGLPKSVARKISTILLYSNRFPPNDLNAYRASVQELVDFLFATYGREQVTKWWFEIGNEPDAPLYFWGEAKQFATMYRAAADVLFHNGLRHVGGLGVTNHAVFLDPALERSAAYHGLLHSLARDSKQREFVSFHLYERESRPSKLLSGLPQWLSNTGYPVLITEWNVSSRGDRAATIFARPGEWGAHFIRLLADCARHGVDRLYLFDLMGYPPHKTPQLGAFDRSGQAKSWFSEFREIYAVVRGGYFYEDRRDALRLSGEKGLAVVLAKKNLRIESPVLYAPLRPMDRRLKAGQWAIVKTR